MLTMRVTATVAGPYCTICQCEYGPDHMDLVRLTQASPIPKGKYGICPGCQIPPPDPKDRNYQARARRIIKRRAASQSGAQP